MTAPPGFPYVEPELQVSSGAAPSHCEVEDSIFRFGSATNASSNKREREDGKKEGEDGSVHACSEETERPQTTAMACRFQGLLDSLYPTMAFSSSSFGVLRCAYAALLLARAGQGGGGEAGARNAVGLIDLDGAVGGSDAGSSSSRHRSSLFPQPGPRPLRPPPPQYWEGTGRGWPTSFAEARDAAAESTLPPRPRSQPRLRRPMAGGRAGGWRGRMRHRGEGN